MKRLLPRLLLLLVLSACTGESDSVSPPVDIEAGKGLVESSCIGCHSLEGRGKTAEIPNLAAQPAAYLAEAMNAYREGRRNHAALKDTISNLSETDILNIAAYFASLPLSLADTAQSQSMVIETAYQQGAEVAAVCAACHGEHGASTTAGIPSLAGQQPVYLMVATQEYASGSRGHAEKEEMLQGLGDVDIEKMAMYFASQLPEPRDPPPFGNLHTGEALTAQCGSCHGARGISHDPMVPNLAGQEPTYLVNAIKAYRDRDRSHENMVTNKSDVDIESIAAWYSVQTAGSLVETGEGAAEVIAKCERCHGETGEGSSMVVPRLNGQKQEYLLHVMKEYRDQQRGNSMMHKMSSGYSDQLLDEIAAYYAKSGTE